MKKAGFTLTELLVVVLIIGILSAVAFPQYQKAVEKARLAEALTVMASLQKAIDVYILQNGYETANFVGNWLPSAPKIELDINIENSLTCPADNSVCWSERFDYDALCEAGWLCQIRATPNISYAYQLYYLRFPANSGWEKECWILRDEGESICKSLESQGWTLSDDR